MKHTETQEKHKEKGYVKTEAEIGMMCLKAKVCMSRTTIANQQLGECHGADFSS